MSRLVRKRLLQMIPVFFLVSLISFALIYVSPGDPVTSMLAANGQTVDPEVAAQMKAELGLDQPVYIQYIQWLGGICSGNLGESIVSGKPVLDELLVRFPVTVFLAVLSLVLTLIISVPVGFLLAVKRNSLTDHVIRVLSFGGSAVPGFLMALLLVYIFALQLGWLPSMGRPSGTAWILPVLTLVICESAVYIRQIRAIVIQELEQDYVEALRMRGIPEKRILWNNVLKAVAPTILILVGMTLGQLLGGTAIIETVFNWPGLGQYAVQEVFARDYPVIQGYVLLMALIFMIVNLVVDLVQARVDPRVYAQLKAGVRA